MTTPHRLTLHDRLAIAERLRAVIDRDFGTVTEFAKRVGMDRSGIQRWLAAESAPSAHALILFRTAGVDLNEIFGEKA